MYPLYVYGKTMFAEAAIIPTYCISKIGASLLIYTTELNFPKENTIKQTEWKDSAITEIKTNITRVFIVQKTVAASRS